MTKESSIFSNDAFTPLPPAFNMGNDLAIKNKYFKEFTQTMFDRIQEGHKKYGDDWRRKDNLKEMEAELFDIANYAYLQWLKLKMKEKGQK